MWQPEAIKEFLLPSVLWMQCEEMGVQLQNCDNSFLYFYKNISNTLTGIDTKGDSVLKMVRNANN